MLSKLVMAAALVTVCACHQESPLEHLVDAHCGAVEHRLVLVRERNDKSANASPTSASSDQRTTPNAREVTALETRLAQSTDLNDTLLFCIETRAIEHDARSSLERRLATALNAFDTGAQIPDRSRALEELTSIAREIAALPVKK